MSHHIVIDARIIASTTGRYVERLLHHLEKIDTANTYTVLVRAKNIDYWKPSNKNFSVIVADFDNYSLNEQVGFLKFLRTINADLVHFCQPEQPVLYAGKKVTTIHDLTLLKTYNPDKNWFVYHAKQFVGKFVFRRVVKDSKYILTPSNFTRSEILDRYKTSPQKIITTHLAAETKNKKQIRFNLPKGEFIMFVGQQSAYKNIVRLAEAHQQLLRKHPKLQLVLVGKVDGPAKKNQTLFKERGYKNIVFTGFVSDEQLNWLYANTAAYVFPSLMEGFGLPGLEAMLQGAPVASSDATCLPEVYGDGALYFNPHSTTDIANTIERIITDPVMKEKLIASGKKQVAIYSWKRTAEQTLEIYKKALSQKA